MRICLPLLMSCKTSLQHWMTLRYHICGVGRVWGFRAFLLSRISIKSPQLHFSFIPKERGYFRSYFHPSHVPLYSFPSSYNHARRLVWSQQKRFEGKIQNSPITHRNRNLFSDQKVDILTRNFLRQNFYKAPCNWYITLIFISIIYWTDYRTNISKIRFIQRTIN